MKKNCYVRLLLLPLLVSLHIGANPTINFFFKPLHDIAVISKKIKKPGRLAKYTARKVTAQYDLVSGLVITYGGYITSPNYNGEVILPRKHQKPVVTILVTPEMTPIALFENTILHWNIVPGVPAKMYSCEQKYNDKKESYYWNVQEVPLPEDNKIPLTAIVIVARPHNVVINVGEFPTNETANLVLPDIYIKKGIDIIQNSAYMLAVRHLFRPVETEEKAEPLKMLTHVID